MIQITYQHKVALVSLDYTVFSCRCMVVEKLLSKIALKDSNFKSKSTALNMELFGFSIREIDMFYFLTFANLFYRVKKLNSEKLLRALDSLKADRHLKIAFFI